MSVVISDSHLGKSTGLSLAPKIAMVGLKVERHTLEDVCSVLKYVEKVTLELNYVVLPIAQSESTGLSMFGLGATLIASGVKRVCNMAESFVYRTTFSLPSFYLLFTRKIETFS